MKSIIISSKPGQLGNMLFLFAHFIAFSIEKNICIKAPAFEEYADYFNSTQQALIPSYPITSSGIRSKWLRKVIYSFSSLFAKSILKLQLNNTLFSSTYIYWNDSVDLENEATLKLFNSRYAFVQGWLYRSDSFVQKHKNAIIDFFSPTENHLVNIRKLLLAEREVLIGVHIRQGDYKTFEGGKYFYDVNQYISLMKRMLMLTGNKKTLFLICSNSALRSEDFQGLPFIFGTGKEIEDLYAFSKCNYLIGPPSTFTMWASFYGNVSLYEVHNPKSEFDLDDFKIILG